MSSSIADHSPGAMPLPFAMALGAIATLARLEASLFFEPTRGNRRVAEARQLAAYLAHVALAMDVADIAEPARPRRVDGLARLPSRRGSPG